MRILFSEALDVFPVYKKVEEHFKKHRIMTDDEFEKIKKEEEDKKTHQELLKMEGGSDMSLLDIADLP